MACILEAGTRFPDVLQQTAQVRTSSGSFVRHSSRRVRYAVRLPDGTVEPAISAAHIGHLVERAGGSGARFTAADAANLLSGRTSPQLLARLPAGVGIFRVGAPEPGATQPQFLSTLPDKPTDTCPTDRDSAPLDPSGSLPLTTSSGSLAGAMATAADVATVPSTAEPASQPLPPTSPGARLSSSTRP